MNTLIDFLFENLFFVILVIGGLFSVFKRMASNENQNDRRRKLEPLPPVAKPFEPPLKRNIEIHNETKTEAALKLEEITTEKIKQIEPDADPIEVEIGSAVPEKGNATFGHRRLSTINVQAFHQPTREKFVEGFIWSEILGSPRSKRPYSPKNRS